MADTSILAADEFVKKLSTDPLFTDHVVRIRSDDFDPECGFSEEHGVCLLADAGYVGTKTLILPFGTCVAKDEVRFLRLHDALRKCVERVFGILQKRFQIILLTRMFFGTNSDRFSRMVRTLAALHNWLHEEDGQDKGWEGTWSSEVLARVDDGLDDAQEIAVQPAAAGPLPGAALLEAAIQESHEEKRRRLVMHLRLAKERSECSWPQWTGLGPT